jgi:hypothetical protein
MVQIMTVLLHPFTSFKKPKSLCDCDLHMCMATELESLGASLNSVVYLLLKMNECELCVYLLLIMKTSIAVFTVLMKMACSVL